MTDLQATAPNTSTLIYKAGVDRYHYEWKTKAAWKDTCRVLVVRLNDGTDHRVYFKFR